MIWSGDEKPVDGVEEGDLWRDSRGWYWRYTIGTDESNAVLFEHGYWALQI